jgi:hypothetical protein
MGGGNAATTRGERREQGKAGRRTVQGRHGASFVLLD